MSKSIENIGLILWLGSEPATHGVLTSGSEMSNSIHLWLGKEWERVLKMMIATCLESDKD